ncbi:MAG: PIG-L deacetylase family protein [Corynebacterium sp.]|uniref:PIG-L deacetylase family protein n=1 Tax=Corynebacterium sp. TaxID=1720 RepID=UPI0026DD4A43|nr:PIG-L deacetylase family protein [Corynebacterium sp.]MDO5099241.1 PIG-L deacetylase family protein [Corynebacterium sp.]
MALYIVLMLLVVALIGYAISPNGRTVFFKRFAAGAQIRGAFIAVLALVLIALGILAVNGEAAWSVTIPLAIIICGCCCLLVVLLRNRIAAPQRAVHPKVVLAVGAHPDDLEIACGGTLARLSDEGHEIHAIVMSDGRQGGDQGVRPDEARNGARTMGIKRIDVYSLTDTRLEDHNMEMVEIVEAKINEINPEVIFTHSIHDQHQDHQAVHYAVLRAARKHPSILCFESPSVTAEFNPAVFIDITDYMDVKVKAVQDHRDQAGKRYLRCDRLKGMANFRGAQGKVELAEGFEIVRLKDSIAGLR